MNAVLVLSIGIVILIVGYIFYGGWLAKQWGVDDSRPTPAHELEGRHGLCPRQGSGADGPPLFVYRRRRPHQRPHPGRRIRLDACGAVGADRRHLFGAVHDYGALFASIRHKGQSIGEVVALNIGDRAKKLFLIFSYLTLVLVVAAFASIVASTFQATYVDGVLDTAASATNASVAMISLLFIVMAVLFGFFVYRRGASLAVATIAGCVGIVICLLIGLNWHPIYLSNSVWMWIIGAYILVASVAPVWILLQPRDYLSSFLLYAMMAIAAVGVIGAGLTGADAAHMDMPAFTGFYDSLAPTGTSPGLCLPRSVRHHRLRRHLRLPLPGGLRHHRQAAGPRAGRQAHRLRRHAHRVCAGPGLPVCCVLHLGRVRLRRDRHPHPGVCHRHFPHDRLHPRSGGHTGHRQLPCWC